MTAEEEKHRERLKILENYIGEYYYMIGNIHVGISDAMESYHKESSKELVEALKSVTEGYKHYSTLLNKHDWKRIHKAEKALENHLKTRTNDSR